MVIVLTKITIREISFQGKKKSKIDERLDKILDDQDKRRRKKK